MAIDPKAFLDLARSICPEGGLPTPSEAQARTAQGRAYYAVYLTIRDRLAQLGIRQTDGTSPHQWLLQQLRTADNNADLHHLSSRLSGMLAIRHDADYEPATKTMTHKDGIIATILGNELLRDFAKVGDSEIQRSVRASPKFKPLRH